MMKTRHLITGVALFLVCLFSLLYWQYITPNYSVSTRIAAELVLPAPPAPGTAAERADIAAVIDAQKNSTPELLELAHADDLISVYRFADIIGPEFTPENLPLTTALFKRVRHDSHLILEVLKDRYDRPRPYVTDSGITITVKKPRNSAYPSGHTSFGYLAATLLAQMLPEKKQAILDRAAVYGRSRVIGGAHYPSDVAAGEIAGRAIAVRLLEDPQFQRDFTQAKAELRSKLGY